MLVSVQVDFFQSKTIKQVPRDKTRPAIESRNYCKKITLEWKFLQVLGISTGNTFSDTK